MNEHEDDGMWHRYTRGPASVAVKTTYSTLRECLPNWVNVGVVRYLDYSTERLPSMNLLECIMHKDVFHRSEAEVRAVALPPVVDALGKAEFERNLFESESSAGFLVYAPEVDVQRLVQRVVLHPGATPEFGQEIARLCHEKSLPAPEPSRKAREAVF